MNSDEVKPGMILMAPKGQVKIIEPHPTARNWWMCEIIWNETERQPGPPTYWTSDDLRDVAENDQKPTKPLIDVNTRSGGAS